MTKDVKRFVRREYKKGASTRKVCTLVRERFGVSVAQDTVWRFLHDEGLTRPPIVGNGNKRTVMGNGYQAIFVGRGKHHRVSKAGYVMEHVLVAEEMLGRPLLPEEVVHHRDLDPSNNAPENLMVLENEAEHRFVHALINNIEKVAKVSFHEALGSSRHVDDAFFASVRPQTLELIHVRFIDRVVPALRRLDQHATADEIKAAFESVQAEIANEDVA